MFQDFDITKNQHVTKHQFLRTLGQLGVTTDWGTLTNKLWTFFWKHIWIKEMLMRSITLISKKYSLSFDFCNDIDSPEQLFGVGKLSGLFIGRGYNHSFDYYPAWDIPKTKTKNYRNWYQKGCSKSLKPLIDKNIK